MPIAIRTSTASDIGLLVSSRLSFLKEVRGSDLRGVADLEGETRSFISAESDAGRLHTWIAEDDGDFAGIVSVLLWPRPPRPEDLRVIVGYIINMYVPPHHQRRGIGQRLLDECLASSQDLGISKFVLHTTDDGLRLYESNGFTQPPDYMELLIPRQ